ncbi:MAG: isochorismatase family protein [Nitrososphaerota archaeon]|nr:isochorismatase family protein [Nitrososphaerota archaeon]MDG6921923.1 isochorismatase family protein [Nitrososphaerota archaeon]
MPYIPDIIPEEDRKALLEKYRSGNTPRMKLGKNPALLIIDMTNAFVLDEYPSGFSKTGLPCSSNIKRLADLCRASKVPVIYTIGVSPDNDEAHLVQRGRWNDKSGKLAPAKVRNRGNTIFKEISPRDNDIVIPKAKPSGFFGTQLVSILNYLGVDTVIVTGMVTSGCVRATVIDSFSYNYKTIIPEECVADRSQISHKVNLFDLDLKYADVLRLSEVMEYISNVRPKTVQVFNK